MDRQTADNGTVVNIVTMKWGTAYGQEHVNKLYRSLEEYLSLPFRFVCFTDDPEGLDREIACFPIPEIAVEPPKLYTGWRKLALFKDELPIEGTCLFLDLDLLIVGSLEDLFSFRPGTIPIIRDWVPLGRRLFPKGPPVGNSSVFRFTANKTTFVYEQFLSERQWALDNFQPPQSYLTHCIRPKMSFWPPEWCVSFKECLRPTFPLNYFIEAKQPPTAKIIVFHGRPNPDQAAYGFKGKRPHHYVRPTSWVREYWEKY